MTTVSLGLTKPCLHRLYRHARVTADAGSQRMPSAPSCALAAAISCSLTYSQAPPVERSTFTAFLHETGLPMRMAVARVSALTETSDSPLVSCMVRTNAREPSA